MTKRSLPTVELKLESMKEEIECKNFCRFIGMSYNSGLYDSKTSVTIHSFNDMKTILLETDEAEALESLIEIFEKNSLSEIVNQMEIMQFLSLVEGARDIKLYKKMEKVKNLLAGTVKELDELLKKKIYKTLIYARFFCKIKTNQFCSAYSLIEYFSEEKLRKEYIELNKEYPAVYDEVIKLLPKDNDIKTFQNYKLTIADADLLKHYYKCLDETKRVLYKKGDRTAESFCMDTLGEDWELFYNLVLRFWESI